MVADILAIDKGTNGCVNAMQAERRSYLIDEIAKTLALNPTLKIKTNTVLPIDLHNLTLKEIEVIKTNLDYEITTANSIYLAEFVMSATYKALAGKGLFLDKSFLEDLDIKASLASILAPITRKLPNSSKGITKFCTYISNGSINNIQRTQNL